MARLINYGPGEASDRLTILTLKILVGTEKGLNVQHFQTEQTALLQQIRSRTLNGAWFEQVLELAAVNGQLWQAEDELRSHRERGRQHRDYIEGVQGDVVILAFRIQSLNDRRAELVQQINRDVGETSGMEKI